MRKMFLKSLVLRGFKTFADNTEIEFLADSRVTAMVGPNGCGKSNLLDATRWVLGEDNPRALRVANLPDIIFAGTANRKSLSLAEVTLIFDNQAGELPVPFTEVAIKRRTFREGESEFFINKNACRLKDIKELLRDTGLGEGTYSIITQGQVDAILSSRGEERRAVFEEAAGVNKYKSRKHSAEKKLIAAEQNILRINDLKIEVSEHLINLEEQARKAREYLEIQARIKEIDLGLNKKLISHILEKRGKLLENLERIKKESSAKKQAEEKDYAELQALKDRHRRLEIEIDETLLRYEEEKDRLRETELDRRFAEGETARAEKSLADLSQRESELQQKIEELRQKISERESQRELLQNLQAGWWQAILQQINQLLQQLSSILAFFGDHPSLSLSFGSSAEKAETYKLKIEMLEEERKKIETEKEKSRFALQAHRSQLENIKSRLGEGKNKTPIAEALQTNKQEKEQLAKTIAALEEKLHNEGADERKVLDEETALEIALAKLEGEMNGIREKLWLEYNLNPDEISTLPYEVANLSRARGEVDEGKQKLRALEPVNLLAIEEFEKNKERLSFIEAQLTDLSAARENLHHLIIELDKKAEENFLETMRQISVVFSETFSKLFAGGEAKIALVPGLPALEAEIEISVRPSGRKWLPLPLLSGGERALSAIAILFSLMKVRPSPFCFLDEVDAALDEANIGRFTQMLKDFSAHTQMLVITHNKRTMAAADSIYGITMEEPGLSKVISMKLAEKV